MKSNLRMTELYEYDDIPDGVKTISAQKILDIYWEFWYSKMVKKYGEGHYLITEQNCIDDWVITNHAWEKEMKLCINCKYYQFINDPTTEWDMDRHMCHYYSRTSDKFDLVTGKKIPGLVMRCHPMRDISYECGEDAKFYQPKD